MLCMLSEHRYCDLTHLWAPYTAWSGGPGMCVLMSTLWTPVPEVTHNCSPERWVGRPELPTLPPPPEMALQEGPPRVQRC